jgi:quercetin dioxygenase-like cupin family protein
MKRITYLSVAVVALAGVVAATAPRSERAAGGRPDGERVKEVARYDLKEKFDGKDASVTVVEVTIAPGQAGLPHHHPGPAFVYVIEGEYELGIDDQPTKIYKAGESFQEPAGHLHRVSKNPAAEGITRLVAVIVHPRGVKDIATPAEQE